MLHDLRIGKPMELAELWTSFEAISELTGIDMPVRTHMSSPSIVRTHYLPCLRLFETKEAEVSSRRTPTLSREVVRKAHGDRGRKDGGWQVTRACAALAELRQSTKGKSWLTVPSYLDDRFGDSASRL